MMSNSGRAVIVILGSTGTGKSKLAIEIAKKFKGEIISADSMQVYKGLDIVTNKVKGEEQEGIPHHLLDCVESTYNYSVTDFRNDSLPILNKLLDAKRLPVIVGGTNYYIESLLWKILVSNDPKEDNGSYLSSDDEEADWKSKLSDLELHNKLKDVDPIMASRQHPSNRRKVIRSLEIFEQQGKRHSDIIAEQKLMDGGNPYGAPLRFNNACIIWINANENVLNERLDKRVDDMMQQGLVDELLTFHKMLSSKASDDSERDYTKGILQSIGFKEFHDFLMLSNDERMTNPEQSHKLIAEGTDKLKLVTRRYARKQIKWIKNRFLKKPQRQVPRVYQLDSTDVDSWKQNVLAPAAEIVAAYMSGTVPSVDPVPIEKDAPQYEQVTFTCEVCQRIFVGELQWDAHLKSRRHKKASCAKAKRAELEVPKS